ncbi:MAG: DUF4388 domain-containing protein [Acidobacteriota bacterium]|nr:DUF4388 domain-containing protein [Acidobacteriota bacterium]
MSISGNLLDVSVADVMQFIHLGGRTGTLIIEIGGKKAEVGFHRGRIISAMAPTSKRLGDLLLEAGVISRATLEEALAQQQAEMPRMSLGKILVSMGAVSRERLREVVAEQIEHTVYDLVTWNEGQFEFAMDELRPIDDIAVYPGDILPDINLNTQIVVLEALRIFDEKNRDRLEGRSGSASEAESKGVPSSAAETRESLETQAELEGELALRTLVDSEGGDVEHPDAGDAADDTPSEVRFQVVSPDFELLALLKTLAGGEVGEVVGVRLWDAGLTLPGESPPVVLVDLRHRAVDTDELEKFRRARAHASIIVICDETIPSAKAYEAGALAVVPPEPEAIVACLASVVRNRWGRVGTVSEMSAYSAGFAKLRRVVADLRSGLLSATVALNLMQVISESVERAVMFTVRGSKLVALGAFGFSMDGEPLAGATRGLAIPLERGSALAEAIDNGQTRSVIFEEANLPSAFAEIVGRPRTGQVVVFPVLGSERVNSVVYTDNGQVSREIGEIEILELAAAQVGVAFENETLRRRMDRLSETKH